MAFNAFDGVDFDEDGKTLVVHGHSVPSLGAGAEILVAVSAVGDPERRCQGPSPDPSEEQWLARFEDAPFGPEDEVFVAGTAKSAADELFIWADRFPLKPERT